MKVQVKCTLDVDFIDESLVLRNGNPLAKEVELAVAEAVMNALWNAQDKGFDHRLDDILSISADNDVVAVLLD